MTNSGSARFGSLAVALAAMVALLGSATARMQATAPPQEATTAKLRVGTFDRRKVLIACYGSEGAALQEVAHQQLEGKAELTDVVAALRTCFPEVAEAARVDLIIERPHWSGDRVELVDLSDALAAKLPPAKK